MQLRVAEEYVRQFGKMAKASTTLVEPIVRRQVTPISLGTASVTALRFPGR
jgi:hypothetical protein